MNGYTDLLELKFLSFEEAKVVCTHISIIAYEQCITEHNNIE